MINDQEKPTIDKAKIDLKSNSSFFEEDYEDEDDIVANDLLFEKVFKTINIENEDEEIKNKKIDNPINGSFTSSNSSVIKIKPKGFER